VRPIRLRSPSSRFAVWGLAAFVGAVSCRGGCDRSEGRRAGGRLALLPVETRLVASIDFARLRDTPVANKLAALAARSAADQAQIDAFKQRTGLDPLTQIDSVLVGFPDEARRRGEIGLILRGAHLDEPRLVAYARDTLQKRGDDLVSTRRGHRILWAARSDPGVAGFFLDDRTFVLGAAGWAEKMADLSDGAPPSGSAETNLELAQLTDRVAAAHAIWAAALVSDEARRRFQADPELKGAAAVLRMALGIDLLGGGAKEGRAAGAGGGGGIDATLTADLTSAAEAQAMVAKVSETLRDAKRNALVLMTGLGPDLDGVTARADGTTFRVSLSLSEPQVTDLLARASAFLELTRQGGVPGFGGH